MKVYVTKTSMEIDPGEVLTEGRVGLECEFIFSEEWEGLAKTAAFIAPAGTGIAVPVFEDRCIIPPEVFTGATGAYLNISVTGRAEDGSVVIPTVFGRAGKIEHSAVGENLPEVHWEPTPDFGAQVMNAADNALASAENAEENAVSAAQSAEYAMAAAEEAADRSAAAEETAAQAALSATGAETAANSAATDARAAAAAATEAQRNASTAAIAASTAAGKANDAAGSASAAAVNAQNAVNTANTAKAQSDTVYAAYLAGELKGKPGDPGTPGRTPVKGTDYFTAGEIAAFKAEVTPVKGVDYFDGEPGYTPVKGVDYFDGEPGEPGHTPTAAEMKAAVQTDLNAKQAKLVSGTNIKTVNGQSLLGSGNIVISGGTDYSATIADHESRISALETTVGNIATDYAMSMGVVG